MPPKAARSRFRAAKRRQSADGSSNASGLEMHEFFRQALTLQPSPSTFDMDSKLEKVELAVACWSNSSMLDETSMTECNGALASVLEVLLRKQVLHVRRGHDSCGNAHSISSGGANHKYAACTVSEADANHHCACECRSREMPAAREDVANDVALVPRLARESQVDRRVHQAG